MIICESDQQGVHLVAGLEGLHGKLCQRRPALHAVQQESHIIEVGTAQPEILYPCPCLYFPA